MILPTNGRTAAASFSLFWFLYYCFVASILLKHFLRPESPAPVTDAVDTARKAKAQAFREQDTLFISKVDQVHTDTNTTLESSMREVLKNYRASFRANQKQPQ